MLLMFKKVLSKAPNGTVYIYMDEPCYDRSTGKSSHKRVCVGKLDSDGNEVYNSRYSAFIGSGGESQVTKAVLAGEKLLLDKTIRQMGLERLLSEVFGEERASALLSLSSYLTAGGKKLSEAPCWLRERGYGETTAEKTRLLLESLGEEEIARFYSLWGEKKRGARSYLYLLRPITSYGRAGTYLERGLNDEEEEEIHLAALSSRRCPLRVAEYEGRCAEDIENLLSSPFLEKEEELTVIGDRKLYPFQQLFSSRGLSYILPVPSGVRARRELLMRHQEALRAPGSILVDKDNEVIHALTVEERGRNGKVYKHLYYDEKRKERENKAFLERLERARSGKKEDRFAKRYLDNPEAAEEFLKGPSACWVLASDSERNAREALCQYRIRNDMELHFDDLRNSVDSGRSGMDESLEGKLFLYFLSLLLVSELKSKASSTGLKRKYHYNWKDILDKVSSYSKVTVGKLELYTAPDEEQRRIFTAFKL